MVLFPNAGPILAGKGWTDERGSSWRREGVNGVEASCLCWGPFKSARAVDECS